MSRFYRLQGLRDYLLYIVRLQLVTEVTGIIHRQKNKVVDNFCRLWLQLLRGSLLVVCSLQN